MQFEPSKSQIKSAENALRWIISKAKNDGIDALVEETGETIEYKSFRGNLPIRMTSDITDVFGYEKSIIIDGWIIRPQSTNKYKSGANSWAVFMNNVPSLNASEYYDLSHNLSARCDYNPYTKIN